MLYLFFFAFLGFCQSTSTLENDRFETHNSTFFLGEAKIELSKDTACVDIEITVTNSSSLNHDGKKLTKIRVDFDEGSNYQNNVYEHMNPDGISPYTISDTLRYSSSGMKTVRISATYTSSGGANPVTLDAETEILIKPLPSLNYSIPEKKLCRGDSLQIHINSGLSGVKYIVEYQLQSSIQEFTFTGTDTTYNISVTQDSSEIVIKSIKWNKNECPLELDDDPDIIRVFDNPSLNISIPGQASSPDSIFACQHDSVNLVVTGADSYSWSFASGYTIDNPTGDSVNFVATYGIVGGWYVVVEGKKENNCIDTDTIIIEVPSYASNPPVTDIYGYPVDDDCDIAGCDVILKGDRTNFIYLDDAWKFSPDSLDTLGLGIVRGGFNQTFKVALNSISDDEFPFKIILDAVDKDGCIVEKSYEFERPSSSDCLEIQTRPCDERLFYFGDACFRWGYIDLDNGDVVLDTTTKGQPFLNIPNDILKSREYFIQSYECGGSPDCGTISFPRISEENTIDCTSGESLKVYPNPSFGEINIIIDNNQLGSINFSFYDLHGKKITQESEYKEFKEQRYTFFLDYLIPGVYYCKVTLPQGEQITKAMIILD